MAEIKQETRSGSNLRIVLIGLALVLAGCGIVCINRVFWFGVGTLCVGVFLVFFGPMAIALDDD